jgi:hypothetical protein
MGRILGNAVDLKGRIGYVATGESSKHINEMMRHVRLRNDTGEV